MLRPTRTAPAVRAPRDTTPVRSRSPGHEQWILAGITLIAAAVRILGVDHQSYWLDEAQAVHEVSLPFGAMLHAWNHFEDNPPLYFVLAWIWGKVFGLGEAGLRSLSVLVGTALVPVMYVTGRELASRRAGLAAALLTALNPFLIAYSQEAREYSLLALTSAVSVLYFARALDRPSGRRILAWAVAAGLALLTQYFAGFLVAAQAVILLARVPRPRSAVAVLALLAVEAALFPHLLPLLHGSPQFIASSPLSLRLQQVPTTFAMGNLYETGLVSWGLIGAAAVAAAMLGLLIAGGESRELRRAGLAAGLSVAVLLIPLVLALLGPDDYIPRVLIPGLVPLLLAIAIACTVAHARAAGMVLVGILLAGFVYAGVRVASTPALQKANWRGVAAALGRSREPRAIVAYDGEFATAPLSIYLRRIPWAGPGLTPVPPRPVSVNELDIVGSTLQELGHRPAGVRLIGSRDVGGYRVVRFALHPAWTLTPAALGQRATALLGPAAPNPGVVIQRPPDEGSGGGTP